MVAHKIPQLSLLFLIIIVKLRKQIKILNLNSLKMVVAMFNTNCVSFVNNQDIVRFKTGFLACVVHRLTYFIFNNQNNFISQYSGFISIVVVKWADPTTTTITPQK